MPKGDTGPSLQAGTHGLQILNAQKEDAGQYTCVVTNELGEAMKNSHVEVVSESGPLGFWPHGPRLLGRLGFRLLGYAGHRTTFVGLISSDSLQAAGLAASFHIRVTDTRRRGQ